MEAIKVLAFGPHPDDIEIGCGGLLAKLTQDNYHVGMVDLTKGEMGSNGTVEQRLAEAKQGAKIIGAQFRINLELEDGNIQLTKENILKVAEVIRKYRPKFLLVPYWQDRHPDHRRASRLISEANFTAGLAKISTDSDPFRASKIFYYFINDQIEPTFIVDIDKVYDLKRQALLAHNSQFLSAETGTKTRLNTGFIYKIESRDRYFGSQIGAEFGEGFITEGPIRVNDLVSFWEE